MSSAVSVYLDDTNFSFLWGDASKEMYMICGYSIPEENEEAFQAAVSKVKNKHGITSEHPIKWNLKNLRDFYDARHESEKLARLLKEADELRLDAFDVITQSQFGIILYSSAVARIQPGHKPRESYQRCFANVLQRIARNIQVDARPHHVYVDFMKEDSDNISACFACCFHRGVDLEGNKFYAGSLFSRGVSQCMYFGKTCHNPFLQVADLVTGCTSDFLEFCFSGKGLDRVVKFFPKILHQFCWDGEADSPLKRGIVIGPGRLYPRVQKGYAQVIAAADNPFL